MKTTIKIAILLSTILTTSVAFAGYNTYGHGCTMSSWDMTEMDANADGSLSFEEFSAVQLKSLRGGYDLIDENNDGMISSDEWLNFLDIHGMKTNS